MFRTDQRLSHKHVRYPIRQIMRHNMAINIDLSFQFQAMQAIHIGGTKLF